MTRSSGEIPTRRFGRTDARVSCIGLGGWHLGVPDTDAAAVRLVHAAIDGGITFLDKPYTQDQLLQALSRARQGKGANPKPA